LTLPGQEFILREVKSNKGSGAAARTRRQVSQSVRSSRLSPTEQRNPRSTNLDKLSLADGITLMIREDARIHRALLAERRPIERALRLIVKTFRQGGRLFYVGAGTSGRLGVLDASECPVTFRTSPEMVQAILAGGPAALLRPVEGAEDDASAGASAMAVRGVTTRDVVLGIAASGTTPFVWGALDAAREHGAKTMLLAFNPYLKIPRAKRPDVCIISNLGPEILTGSTRLKAGAATKLVLNVLTTLAMVRLGKVSSNLMVDMVPTNEKLRNRATRMVQELTGADYTSAEAALLDSGGVIKKAVARLSRRSDARPA
jgi:N-acetylmuramic acid 6-phosphate etherase